MPGAKAIVEARGGHLGDLIKFKPKKSRKNPKITISADVRGFVMDIVVELEGSETFDKELNRLVHGFDVFNTFPKQYG